MKAKMRHKDLQFLILITIFILVSSCIRTEVDCQVIDVNYGRVEIAMSVSPKEDTSTKVPLNYKIEYNVGSSNSFPYISTYNTVSKDGRNTTFILDNEALNTEGATLYYKVVGSGDNTVKSIPLKPLFEPRSAFPNPIIYTMFQHPEYYSIEIAGKAYVYQCMHNNVHSSMQANLWQYDPKVDKWTKLPLFPGCDRTGVIMFTHGEKLYIGLGEYTSSEDEKEEWWTKRREYDDIWQLDLHHMKWTKVATFAGGKRGHAASFIIGDEVYIFGGQRHYKDIVLVKDKALTDIWKWNIVNNTFSQIGKIPSIVTSNGSFDESVFSGVGTVLDNKGYICHQKGVWSYNTTTKIFEKACSPNNSFLKYPVMKKGHSVYAVQSNEGISDNLLSVNGINTKEHHAIALFAPCFVIDNVFYGYAVDKQSKSSLQHLRKDSRVVDFGGAFGKLNIY